MKNFTFEELNVLSGGLPLFLYLGGLRKNIIHDEAIADNKASVADPNPVLRDPDQGSGMENIRIRNLVNSGSGIRNEKIGSGSEINISDPETLIKPFEVFF
jgi:hypothetical protein